MSASVEARDITKAFGHGPSRVSALRGISLSLRAGSLTLVRGPSGSGKSSLLAALGGLQAPDSGRVIALGADVWAGGLGKVLAFRRKHCGYVFQSPGLFPGLSALDQVAAPLRLLGTARREALLRAEAWLDRLGLADRLHDFPSQLSGGQNQRIAIARMLAKRTALLFCDEPTSALDSTNGRLVAGLLRETASERNATVLCMSHDERLVPFSDRVVEIEDGQLTSDSEGMR